MPRDYADAFTVLEQNAVLDAGLAERLRALARLRNLLVHAYGDVDDSLVHTSLHGDLDDLDAFARAIGRLVAEDE